MANRLKGFSRDIWIADGGLVTAAAGFHYPTRMAVIRLKDGLFIWSPISLDDALRAELAALGEVAHLVAPNSLHHVFLGDWQMAFPSARTYLAPGLRKKRKDLRFDHELGDAPVPEWGSDIDQVIVHGNAITAEVIFFHRPSGTVLFTDLLQNFPRGWFRGWRGLVARLDLMLEREPSVPRKFRLAFTGKNAARAAIRRILAWPAEKVLMAHGEPVVTDAPAYLRRAFRWLGMP